MSRVHRLAFLLTLIATAATAAHAQTSPEPEPITRAEPVIVQAPLLTESPATVSTVELAAAPQAEATLPQLAADTANFFIGSNDAHGFNDTYALRGLTNTPIFGDPAISFYLDDLPLGSGFTFPTDLTGFARAELHRGPSQNTVFGRAGSAGVVTLLTPQPGTAPAGEIRASVGNFHARRAAVSASSSAGGSADAYAAATYSARDGYITNTQLHHDVDDKESLSALARVRVRPTATAELTFLVTALRARDGAQPLVPLGGPLFTVSRSAEGRTDVDATNAALSAAFATPIGRLTATTSFTDWELGPALNTLDFGFAELTNDSRLKQRLWNEELKLVSDTKADLRWQAGAFYSDGTTDGGFLRQFGPYVYEQSSYRIDARDLAAFGEATWHAAPALTFTAGLRAEDSKKDMTRRELVPVAGTYQRTRESTALLPKLGASYALDHHTSLFATLGAGFKPGGFSAFTGNRALSAFGPERSKTIEAGVTHTSPDAALSTTARVFYYDITGYQIERSFATSSITDDYLVVNAPRARSFGGELEFTWKPVAGLTVAAALGTTDVTLRDFRDPYTGTSYDGKRAPYVPAFDASLRVDYRHATGWFVGGQLATNGRTYYTESENLTFGQRAYTLLGAHLGYDAARYRVTFFGANLTDEEYYAAISPGTGHATPGTPRTYGVELAVKW